MAVTLCLECFGRHGEGDRRLGTPLCPDCYDYPAHVMWNLHAGELWRRTTTAMRKYMRRLARSRGIHPDSVRLAMGKAAEMQRRGVAHFHAIVRLDGADPHNRSNTAPLPLPPGFTAYDLVAAVEDRDGPIDLFVSNAGIGTGMGLDASDEAWAAIWGVNVMAHVYAARAVVPSMVARGEGYLLNTASAAGLLAQIGDAPYSVTKHAAEAFAEWLAITYGDAGIKVSCLCPQGVRTDLLAAAMGLTSVETVVAQGLIEPSDVAAAVIEGLRDERFLILPHPEVAGYYTARATDTDAWLGGMNRLQQKIEETQR